MKRFNMDNWIEWFHNQSNDDKIKIAINAIEHLIEIQEVGFSDYLYWTTCGENLIDC